MNTIIEQIKMYDKHKFLPATLTTDLGSIKPLLGRTQYRLGAVVFTLKHTRLSVGFVNFKFEVTTSVNGPEMIE